MNPKHPARPPRARAAGRPRHLWAVPTDMCTTPDTGGNGGSLPCLACGVPVCACEGGHLRGREEVRTCDACGNPFWWVDIRVRPS